MRAHNGVGLLFTNIHHLPHIEYKSTLVAHVLIYFEVYVEPAVTSWGIVQVFFKTIVAVYIPGVFMEKGQVYTSIHVPKILRNVPIFVLLIICVLRHETNGSTMRGRAATGGTERGLRFAGARTRKRRNHAPSVRSWVVLAAGPEGVSGRLFDGELAHATKSTMSLQVKHDNNTIMTNKRMSGAKPASSTDKYLTFRTAFSCCFLFVVKLFLMA